MSDDFNGDCFQYVANAELKQRHCEPALRENIELEQSVYWSCEYGEQTCKQPFQFHYELYTDELIRFWNSYDHELDKYAWLSERVALHSLGERRTPIRGRFNNISRDIRMANQPSYYIEAITLDALTLKPVAEIKLANSWLHLFIPLGDSLLPLTRNARKKVTKYGKPLPQSVHNRIIDIINEAVTEYKK